MRIMNFKIGKSKKKTEKDAAEAEGTTVEQIVETEEKINGRTKDPEETAQQSQELSDEGDTPEKDGDASAGPHKPLDELTIEPVDKLAEVDDIEVETVASEEDGEEIKVVEVSAGSAAPPPEGEKEVKVDDVGGDSINSLFSDDEDEENPLANLIKSLPDVTAEELIDDLNEIKGIIKEWQQS